MLNNEIIEPTNAMTIPQLKSYIMRYRKGDKTMSATEQRLRKADILKLAREMWEQCLAYRTPEQYARLAKAVEEAPVNYVTNLRKKPAAAASSMNRSIKKKNMAAVQALLFQNTNHSVRAKSPLKTKKNKMAAVRDLLFQNMENNHVNNVNQLSNMFARMKINNKRR